MPAALVAKVEACSGEVRSANSTSRVCGLLRRKERWGLSWRGWLICAVLVVATSYAVVLSVHPFLAVTDRIDANILVVEGWVHEYAIEKSADEFRTGTYEHIFTTGGPVEGKAGYINDFQTSASVGADLLKKEGIPGESLQMVPSRVASRDRTYGSAVALREWLQEHNMAVRGFNVVTEDTHARRTRLLFQEAFGKGIKVGIIAVPNPDYDARHWWRYSEGVKDVVTEGVAYLYAKFLFWPSSPKDETTGQRDHRQ